VKKYFIACVLLHYLKQCVTVQVFTAVVKKREYTIKREEIVRRIPKKKGKRTVN
jgi:hypothetical protein